MPPRVSAVLVPVMLPANVSVVVLLTVKVAAPPPSVTVPVPVTLATVWELPARSKVPGEPELLSTSRLQAKSSTFAAPSAAIPWPVTSIVVMLVFDVLWLGEFTPLVAEKPSP